MQPGEGRRGQVGGDEPEFVFAGRPEGQEVGGALMRLGEVDVGQPATLPRWGEQLLARLPGAGGRATTRWLAFYNAERPHQGCHNRGKLPFDTVVAYLAQHATTVTQETHGSRCSHGEAGL